MQTRIENAFGQGQGGTEAQAVRYLDIIRGNWQAAEGHLRRTTLGLIVVVTLFELVRGAGIAEFDLGPIKVTDLELIARGIPVAFSYLTLEWVALAVLINRLSSIHDGVIQQVFPSLADGNLEIPLAPAVMSLAAESRLIGEAGRAQSMMVFLSIWKTRAFLLLLLGAHMYFYQRQFSFFGLSDFGVWITVGLSLLLMLQASLLVWKFFKDPVWT